MEKSTPEDNEENHNDEGSEKEKKKKKKKHKHRKHHGSDSEDEEKKTIDKKNQSIVKDLITDCFVLLHVMEEVLLAKYIFLIIYVKIYQFQSKKKKKNQVKFLNSKQKAKFINLY